MNSLIIGIMAGVLCTISFIPQVVKIFRSKHTRDLSLVTFSLFFVGITLWLIYGILIRELPVILANAATLCLILMILVMKIKYK